MLGKRPPGGGDIRAASNDAKLVLEGNAVGHTLFPKSVIKSLAFNEDNFCFKPSCAFTKKNSPFPKSNAGSHIFLQPQKKEDSCLVLGTCSIVYSKQLWLA